MAIVDTLVKARSWLPGTGWAKSSIGDEPPLRSELFSAVQMEQHGKKLAASHALAKGRAQDRLLARLTENAESWWRSAACSWLPPRKIAG